MKLPIASLACLALASGCASTTHSSFSQPDLAWQQDASKPPNYPQNYPPPMTSLPPAPPPEVRYLPPPAPPPSPPRRSAQGWFGINYLDTRNVDTDSPVISDIDVDSTNMPVFGGAFMFPLGGERLQFGIESGLSFGWQGNVSAVAIGGGGVAVAADTDVFLWDIFVGPYASLDLNPRSRLYFAAGFVLEWANFDYEISGANDIHEDGFGDGVYARTGFEFQTGPGTWIGLGVRWLDTTIDPGGKVDSVDLEQTQYLITATHSM